MALISRGCRAMARVVAVLALVAAMPHRAMGADTDVTTVSGTVQCYILITAPQVANLFLLHGDTEDHKRIEVTAHVFSNAKYDLTLSGTSLVNDDVSLLPEFVWTVGGTPEGGPRVGWWDATWRETSTHVLRLPRNPQSNHTVDIEVHMDGGFAPPHEYEGLLTITPSLAE